MASHKAASYSAVDKETRWPNLLGVCKICIKISGGLMDLWQRLCDIYNTWFCSSMSFLLSSQLSSCVTDICVAICIISRSEKVRT